MIVHIRDIEYSFVVIDKDISYYIFGIYFLFRLAIEENIKFIILKLVVRSSQLDKR